MRLIKNQSCLLLVDVQEKLAPMVMHADVLIDKCAWLMRLASELKVPLITSEQYPQGLGNTISPLIEQVQSLNCIEKVHFSGYREPEFLQVWNKIGRHQVVIIGIETHVCVLQTAMDMNEAGFDVFVVVDALSARQETDHHYGLQRMQQAGIHLVTAEMVFFEWVEKAGTPEFKQLSKAFLRE